MKPLIWDPDPVAFTLPFVGRPILWYGILFALGYFFAYLIVLRQLKKHFSSQLGPNSEVEVNDLSQSVISQLLIWVGLGLLIGARLFHVIFYDFNKLLTHPLSALNAWEGGLASHGGAIGAVLGLYFAYRFNRKLLRSLPAVKILDFFVPAAAVMGTLIRIGNFINQEILGKASSSFFSVIFLHPSDGATITARHPVQLYESLFFALFLCLTPLLIRLLKEVRAGALAGIFIVLTFIFRFWIEGYKLEQSVGFSSAFNMGAWLSIPMILFGLTLVWRSFKGGISIKDKSTR